jgi:succinyl-CoA---D-citramalate CoA-transferase
MFERLAAAMARPELAAEFPTMASRLERRADLDAIVQTWVGSAEARDVLARLDAAEVPCGPVTSARDLFGDPHVRARNNIVEMPNPLGGVLAMVGIVPRLTESPGRVEAVGPVEVGAHNEEIYCGRLGLTRDELHALAARGVV